MRKFLYDIYGLVLVESFVDLYDLQCFLVSADDHLSHEISINAVRIIIENTEAEKSDSVSYQDKLVNFSIQRINSKLYKVRVSALLSRCNWVLYYNLIEPLIRISLVENDHILLHSACISRDNYDYLIVGPPDVGKTTTSVRLAANGSFKLVDDDMTIITPENECLAYPKALTLSPSLSNHCRPNSTLWPAKFLIYNPKIRRLILRASTKSSVFFFNVLIQTFFPPPKFRMPLNTGNAGKIKKIFLLEKGRSSVKLMTSLEAKDKILSANRESFEFPPYRDVFQSLRGFIDATERESRIITGISESIPIFQVSSDTNWDGAILNLFNQR